MVLLWLGRIIRLNRHNSCSVGIHEERNNEERNSTGKAGPAATNLSPSIHVDFGTIGIVLEYSSRCTPIYAMNKTHFHFDA